MDRTAHGFSKSHHKGAYLYGAASVIDSYQYKEEAYPDLYHLRGASASPSLLPGHYKISKTHRNFRNARSYVIPTSLLREIEHCEWKVVAGVFAEINRAWITIDNTIYLWNYYNQADIVVYDGLDQIILSVGLVKPREGVFVDEVKYLLVLTTPIQVVLLAVTFGDNTNASSSDFKDVNVSELKTKHGVYSGTLKLNPTKFSVAADKNNMIKVLGTKNGRIFMTSRDGSLFELIYQAEDSWFSRKCRKLNHTATPLSSFVPNFLKFQTDDPLENIVVDEFRNILYTLSSSQEITVYDLGSDGEKMIKIAKKNTIIRDVKALHPNWSEDSLHIVSMHVVRPSESLNVHLICCTKGGHRLAFTTQSPNSISRYSQATRPNRLILVLVREPLTRDNLQDTTGALVTTTDSSVSLYSPGMFLYANYDTDKNDSLVSVSLDLTDLAAQRSGAPRIAVQEDVDLQVMDGKVWGIVEVPLEQLIPQSLTKIVNTNERIERNDLAQQHILPPRQFIILTDTGLHILEKSRPVDALKDILNESGGVDSPDLRNFFQTYGVDQSCAMCLILATQGHYPQLQSSSYNDPRNQRNMRSRQNPDFASWATAAFFRLGGRPSYDFSIAAQIDGRTTPKVMFSGSHNGFALYLSRLLYPIWSQNILVPNQKGFSCCFNEIQFGQLEWQLTKLRHFLQQNPQFASLRHDSGLPVAAIDPYKPSPEFATKSEQESLSTLHQLLLRSIEALALLGIMSGMDLSKLSLSRSTKLKIGSFKFKDLIIANESEVVRELIHGMTTVYSEQATKNGTFVSISELTDNLRSRCPSYFSDADKTRLQAMDLLFKARTITENLSTFERWTMLQESLVLFKKIAGQIATELPHICTIYQYLRFYEGVVELALECAKFADPNHIGLDWMRHGKRSEQAEQPKELTESIQCYQQIFFVLNELYGLGGIGSERPTSPTDASGVENGSQTIERPEISEADRKQIQSRTLKICKQSQDEVFHIHFYQWFVDQNMADTLLQMDTPFLDSFFRFYCTPKEARSHLLWQYYLHCGELTKAAIILIHLAERTGTDFADQTLADRLSYLSQANSLLKASPGDHKLLREVQEKVDVGAVQLKVYNELEFLAEEREKAAARQLLNSKLYTMSELFNQFAKVYGLSQSALAILHASGHQDAQLARKLWETMIINEREGLTDPSNPTPLASLVSELATEYYPSEYVLPLDFLAEFLEQQALDMGVPDSSTPGWYRGWVVSAFLRAQVPAAVLFKIYNSLYDGKTSTWTIPEHQRHLLVQITFILEAWTEELSSDAARVQETKFFKTKVEPFIDKYLAVLAKIQPGIPDLAVILRRLKTPVQSQRR